MRISLRQKMAIIVCAVAVSFAFLTAVTWFLDAETERQTAVIRDHYIPHVELGYRLETIFENMTLSLRDAVSAQDLGGLDTALKQKEEFVDELQKASNILGAEQVKSLNDAIEEYFSVSYDMSKRLINGETGLSLVDSMTLMQTKRATAESTLKAVTSFDRGKLRHAFDTIFLSQERGARIQFWTSVICVLLIFLTTIYIGRSLMLHVKTISAGLTKFGAGNFEERIPLIGDEELTELSRQINKMADRIQKLLREIESFSYSVAHDLRAPLRSVLGFGDALTEDYGESLPPDGKALLSRITMAAKRMAQMVDGLLSLSRLNRTAISKQTFNLSKIVQQAFRLLSENEPNRKVTSNIEDGVSADGDPRLVDVVISNLIGNAWKFTKHVPSAHIQFGTKREKNELIYFIRDNGAGFDMRYSDKLFGTFQRLHTEKEFEGYGIGLATVKNVIEKHEGRIWAESEPGKGATFYFTLG